MDLMANYRVQINKMIMHQKGIEHFTVAQKVGIIYILFLYLCQTLVNTFGFMPNIKAVKHCCEIVGWYKP